MLYRITASHEDGFVETIIEAPKHNRFGWPPQALVDWVRDVWAPDVLRDMAGDVTVEIERYEPARIGYAPGNNGHAVSTTLAEFDFQGMAKPDCDLGHDAANQYHTLGCSEGRNRSH